jgi:hypothetical protein
MSKLKMPCPYVSYSQLALFERDPLEYYQQYFVARVDYATDKMNFGKIFQEAWCDPKYNYQKALQEAGFTSDYVRVIKTALSHPKTIKFPKIMTEHRITVKTDKMLWPMLAILDGFDKSKKLICENKMGIWWTDKMVKESPQITWQMMSIKIQHGFMPKEILQSFNSRTGEPRLFVAKRNKKDFDDLIIRVNNMVTKVQAGDFNK